MRSFSQVLFALVLVLVLPAALAQPGPPPAGDAAHGGQVAAEHCSSCHGQKGESTDPGTPRLDGQVLPYLLPQIFILQAGIRPTTVENHIPASLTQQDLADLAAFFSSQAPAGASWEGQDASLMERGKTLFEDGDVGVGLIACAVCHGAVGEGVAELSIPRITGQAPTYVAAILNEFAQVPDFGVPAANAMHVIASRLSAPDLNAIVAYLAGQPWGSK